MQNDKIMENLNNTIEVKQGDRYIFTPTGKEIEIAKVGSKNVSWYVGFVFKQGSGKNIYRMTHTSIKTFVEGITRGTYRKL